MSAPSHCLLVANCLVGLVLGIVFLCSLAFIFISLSCACCCLISFRPSLLSCCPCGLCCLVTQLLAVVFCLQALFPKCIVLFCNFHCCCWVSMTRLSSDVAIGLFFPLQEHPLLSLFLMSFGNGSSRHHGSSTMVIFFI